MYLRCMYRGPSLNVDYYPHFLTSDLGELWYTYLVNMLNCTGNRRQCIIIGNTDMVYTINYRGESYQREIIPWDSIPSLYELKTLVENITKQTYTVCAIQIYPNGKTGIGAHRDKEMVSGTRICGLSLGAKRTIQFSRTGYDPLNLQLHPGSLYVMNHPTNQSWLHEIVKDPHITEPRISLTFRDYR